MKTLEQLLKEMPPEIKREVRDFAQFLLDRESPPKRGRMRLTWAGSLRQYRDRFTSLELQKKSLEWWGD